MTITDLLSRVTLARIALGWGAFLALLLCRPLLPEPLPSTAVILLLVAIVGVILVCAFGVVHEAEHLAHRLGDPYGSLVLTLSIVLIEVVLIAAVMLGPGDHATIARDSVMAVAMIIMTLVIGLCLLLGGTRHGDLEHHRVGSSTYLVLIVVLAAMGLAVPRVLGVDGSYSVPQAIVVVVVTVALYAHFLWRQMGEQATDFQEVAPVQGRAHAMVTEDLPGEGGGIAGSTLISEDQGLARILQEHRTEVLGRLAILVVTVMPIVLLSHDMAELLDVGLARAGAPVALSGVVIAMIVFLPESITALRAALAGEIQRVINLCHGALVSTVGLTIPVVLVIGILTGQTVVLGESPINLLLLGVTVLIGAITFSSPRVTAVHGAAHLAVFAIYALSILGS